MSHPQRIKTMIVAATLVIATCLTGAQQPVATGTAGSAALSDRIPLDPSITTGQFRNGLRYYVRANRKPENRAELRLVVDVGSILEEDDQLGLAHFVEHMAFNGTKNFPKQEIVAFMESIGMRFGPSVNAFTSFDETVYMLQVPTDRPEVLERAFLVLEDWAHNVSFDPAEIDKERGVIIEEWRLRRGAAARMQDQQFPILLKGSRYAERLPIGKVDVIRTFEPERLTQFYRDWYRPDLMAVIAVGDFDATAVQKLIEKHFASIPAPGAPAKRPAFEVPDHPATLYAVATDTEASGTSVAVYAKLPLRDPTILATYREQIIEQLFSGMLSARFSEIAQQPDAPFLAAGGGRGLFVRTKEVASLNAIVKEDGIERGLEALFLEAERVARFGFTAPELDRQKRNVLRGLERAVAEKDNQISAALAAEYIRNFTQHEPIPGITYEYELHQRFLPEITVEEVNRIAKNWMPDRNRVVVVSAPQKEGLAIPDEQKLAAAIAAAATSELKPYVDTTDDAPLLETTPEPGTITRTTAREAFGITEWQLSNGVKVVLKPTNFKEDEVLVRATSPGGTSLASDEEIIPASTAVQVVSAGGLGRFSSVDLRKALTGKVASVRPFIGETEEGLSGSASRRDLETMFQLVYLTFTQPRADTEMFRVVTGQMRTLLANQRATPEFAFAETLQSVLTQNHPRARPLTPELVDQMDLEKSFAFYKDRFADAGDFTFVFVGSFDLETMRPLVEKYLGSLPSSGRKETWKDTGVRPPTGVVERRVEKGIEPKSRASVVFTGPFEFEQEQRIALNATTQVLQTRLRETLREELGGTYGVNVSPSYRKMPVSDYQVSINFGSDPERTEELLTGVFQEIELLGSKGPPEKQVSDVREALLRDYETNAKQNSYWVAQIALRHQFSEDLDSLFALTEYYNRLTPAMIQQAAQKYLNTSNYVKVTLFPEAK